MSVRRSSPVIPFTVRLPPAVYAAIKERAERTGETQTDIVVEALRNALKRDLAETPA